MQFSTKRFFILILFFATQLQANNNPGLKQLADQEILEAQKRQLASLLFKFQQEELSNTQSRQQLGNSLNVKFDHLDEKYVREIIENSPDEIKRIIKNYHLSKKQSNPKKAKMLICSELLLQGQPGVGKTDLARALAQTLGAQFLFVPCGNLKNEFQNSAIAGLGRIFEFAENLESDFVVIILDEIQCLIDTSNDMKSQDASRTLAQMMTDASNKKNIMIIATANDVKNLPDFIQNRFGDKLVMINKPDQKKREQILNYHLKDIFNEDGVDLPIALIAKETHGLVARDLYYLSERCVDYMANNLDKNLLLENVRNFIKIIKSKNAEYGNNLWQKSEHFLKRNGETILNQTATSLASTGLLGLIKIAAGYFTTTASSGTVLTAVAGGTTKVVALSAPVALNMAGPGLSITAASAVATAGTSTAATVGSTGIVAGIAGATTTAATATGAALVAAAPVAIPLFVAVGGGYVIYWIINTDFDSNAEKKVVIENRA